MPVFMRFSPLTIFDCSSSISISLSLFPLFYSLIPFLQPRHLDSRLPTKLSQFNNLFIIIIIFISFYWNVLLMKELIYTQGYTAQKKLFFSFFLWGERKFLTHPKKKFFSFSNSIALIAIYWWHLLFSWTNRIFFIKNFELYIRWSKRKLTINGYKKKVFSVNGKSILLIIHKYFHPSIISIVTNGR